MRFTVSVGILLCLCGMLWAAAGGATYTIVLDRVATVGQKYHISVDGFDQRSVKTTSGGKLLENESADETLTMKLDGVVSVVQVDKRGQPTELTLTITKCAKIVNNIETPLAAPGAVVDASVKDKKNYYTIDGAPVSDDLQTALDLAITLSSGDAAVTDGDMFGTTTPQHVGDSWSINSGKVAENLLTLGYSVVSKDIQRAGDADGSSGHRGHSLAAHCRPIFHQ